MIVPLKMARNFWLRSFKISYTPLVWTNEIPILVESHGNSGDSPDQVKKNTKQSWKHRLKLVKYGQIPSFADYINVSIFHHFPSFDAKKTPCLAENFAKSRWCLTSTHARPTIWPAQLGSDDGGRFFYVWSIRQEIGIHENSGYLGFWSGSWIFRICSGYWDPWKFSNFHSWCWLDGDLWMSTENLCRGHEISIEILSFLPWSEFDQIPLVIEGQPWGIKGIRESMAQELRWEKLKIHEGLSQVHSTFFLTYV